jgi:hypothetical protein
MNVGFEQRSVAGSYRPVVVPATLLPAEIPARVGLLPAGAVAGWDSHPLEKRRLFTAHTLSGSSSWRKAAVQRSRSAGAPVVGAFACERTVQRIENDPAGGVTLRVVSILRG